MIFQTFKRWKDLSISFKLYSVVGIMALLILIELLTLRFAMGNLSAVRAFVGGEGLWTKAQKQAVYQLQRYARTKNVEDYHAFLAALKVNDGDHLARIELSKPEPDMKIVYQGFLAGQIHPDDIMPMVQLLRRFHSISYISEAVSIWTAADVLIDELKVVGLEYHRFISSGSNNQNALAKIANRLNELNNRLSIVTASFSTVLGEGSRWLERLVFMILFSLVLTVETVGLTLTFFTSRSLSEGLNSLIHVAEKIGKGEFEQRLIVDSKDEIGQLKVAVNNMGSMLQHSYRDLEEKINIRTQELAKIASENARLYDQAKHAVKMRDEFVSIAAHELKTPITSLVLYLQRIEKIINNNDKPIDHAKVAELANRGVLMGRQLSNLQDVLMDLTSISVGKIELKKETMDLVAVASDVVNYFAQDTLTQKVQIKIQQSKELNCQADPVRMGQVLTNLINNAIKYGDGSAINITFKNDISSLSVSVTDYGPGIPPEKQAIIFERFERANSDQGVSGLGLGLYISQQIIEAHGGKLTLKSDATSGSTFTMTIPA